MTSESASVTESAMLRASIAFTFDNQSHRVRKSIFDYMTLAILEKNGMTQNQIISAHEKAQGGIRPQESQVEASLQRLITKGLLVKSGDLFSSTDKAIITVESSTIRANEDTESLISDIIEEITQISGKKLSVQDCGVISVNTRDIFLDSLSNYSVWGFQVSCWE